MVQQFVQSAEYRIGLFNYVTGCNHAEVIVDRDPAIIIASYGDNISDMPAFADILAVRKKAIYVPSSDALSIAGPRFVSGIEELAAWVYPDLLK